MNAIRSSYNAMHWDKRANRADVGDGSSSTVVGQRTGRGRGYGDGHGGNRADTILK